MSLYLPSRRNPVIRPTINLGLIPSSTSGPNPRFSSTSGRYGSRSMSVVGMSDFMKFTPLADFMSTAIEVLWRVRRSGVGAGGSSAACEWVRLGIARSMRSTAAPLSAKRSPAKGAERYQLENKDSREWGFVPGARLANSKTRIPLNTGAGMMTRLIIYSPVST